MVKCKFECILQLTLWTKYWIEIGITSNVCGVKLKVCHIGSVYFVVKERASELTASGQYKCEYGLTVGYLLAMLHTLGKVQTLKVKSHVFDLTVFIE